MMNNAPIDYSSEYLIPISRFPYYYINSRTKDIISYKATTDGRPLVWNTYKGRTSVKLHNENGEYRFYIEDVDAYFAGFNSKKSTEVYVIATLYKDGTYNFDSKVPMCYNEQDARNECEKYTKLYGRTYVYFKRMGSCSINKVVWQD